MKKIETKNKKVVITKTLYCPHCDKAIHGFDMQAEHNLAVHIMTQHKDLLEKKKGGRK